MFECKNITLNRQNRVLISMVNVAFNKGTITAIIGANGAGKSTLLKVLLGEFHEHINHVNFDQRCLNDYTLHALAKKRSYVSQHTKPSFSIAVYHYLLLPRKLYRESQKQSLDAVQKVADMYKITRLLDRDLLLLSGGEAQLVEFARAYLQLYEHNMNDKCLLLDEPASALDIKQTSMLYEHLLHIRQQGITVILVDHDINAMASVADDIVLLKQGQIVAFGNKKSIFNKQNLDHCFDVNGEIFNFQENMQKSSNTPSSNHSVFHVPIINRGN